MNTFSKSFFEKISDVSFFSFSHQKLFQQTEVDHAGNFHFIKNGSGEKIQIIFRINPSCVIAEEKKEDKCYATYIGNDDNPSETMLYQGEEPKGILRKENDQYYIENFGSNAHQLGEYFTFKNNTICKGGKLYASNLDEVLAAYFGLFLSSMPNNTGKHIDFTVWNSSKSKKTGLVSAINYRSPETVVYISLIEEKLFADINPSIVLKDGNYVMAKECKNFMKQRNKEFDSYFVGKTDDTLEFCEIEFFQKKILGLYIPVLYKKSNMQEILIKHVEKTQQMLLKLLATL